MDQVYDAKCVGRTAFIFSLKMHAFSYITRLNSSISFNWSIRKETVMSKSKFIIFNAKYVVCSSSIRGDKPYHISTCMEIRLKGVLKAVQKPIKSIN